MLIFAKEAIVISNIILRDLLNINSYKPYLFKMPLLN